MKRSSNDKNEIPEDFDRFEFGIPSSIGYGKTKTVKSVFPKSKSTAVFICNILKECIVEERSIGSSFPFHVGLDDADRLIYIRTEVKFQHLNTGTDLTDKETKEVMFFALPGDRVHPYVPKKLGGFGSFFNSFPLNSNADIKSWEEALTKVYDHVKGGEEKSARIMYAMVHAYLDEYAIGNRPSYIYYIFKLYSRGQLIEEKIEGRIHNTT